MKSCISKTEDGKACEAPLMEGSDFCFFHNPDKEVTEKRNNAVTTGGLNGKRKQPLEPVRVKSLEDLAVLLETTINDVRADRIGTNQANAVGYLASTLAKVFETRDLAVKVQAIEVVLKRRSDHNG
jgi:hypothetical protein